MKKLVFIFIACFSFSVLSAQTTPLQFRLYGEGGYYFPSSETSFSVKDHDGSGAGFGLYGLTPLYKKWSLLAGLGYRYLNNGQSLTCRMTRDNGSMSRHTHIHGLPNITS